MLELEQFFAGFEKTTHSPGDLLLSPDEPPKKIFYLQKGIVKIYTYSANGSTITLHLFFPGSFFPMGPLFSDQPNRYYYECLTPVILNSCPPERIKNFLKTHPNSLFNQMGRLVEGMDKLVGRLECHMSSPVYLQVVNILLYFSRHLGEPSGETVVIGEPLTHQTIADWVGCTREMVSVNMEKLRLKGLISYKKSLVTILRPEKLKKLLS